MQEIWKDIKDYEGIYQASSLGRIRSLTRIDSRGRLREGRIMPLRESSDGYYNLKLCKNGGYKTVAVHRVIAETFIEYPKDGKKYEVNHIDMDRKNNRLDNLEYLTHAENVKHSSTKGKYRRYGGKNSRAIKVVLEFDNKSITFDCIKDCCIFIKDKEKIKTKINSIHDSICKYMNKDKYYLKKYKFKTPPQK